MKPDLQLTLAPPEQRFGRSGFSVRYQTEAVNPDGSVVPLQSGHNEITDWGMDALATTNIWTLCNYLQLSSTLGPINRIGTGSGTTLTLAVTDATSIAVTASANFFQSGDVGNTLSIDGNQELKITAYTDATHVTCATRQGFWLSGSAPGGGPYSNFGVHFTSVNALNAQFTKYSAYDTSATNYQAELNDSGNSRTILQRIFLSAAVTGSAWTINQLGWSDGNGSNYVFGKANLASPDTVAVGQKYRVTLQVYCAYTPIDIPSFSANWGPTIGTYDVYIKQEIIPYNNTAANAKNFLMPWDASGSVSGGVVYSTTTFSTVPVKWEGDSGYTASPHSSVSHGASVAWSVIGAYTSGSHTRTKTLTMSDSFAVTAATGICFDPYGSAGNYQCMTIKPNSGTITKPAGYKAILTFPLVWTRQLVN